MGPVSILDFGSYLPETEVGVDFYAADGRDVAFADSPLFRAPKARRHVAPGERAAEMIEKATLPMLERLGRAPADIDILLTNVLLPDLPFTGCGAEVAQRLGWTPEWILDVHNSGCASFLYMIKLAGALMNSGGGARTALLCNVQNTAGQLFTQSDIRTQPHAAGPGDGCGVAFLEAGDTSPVLALLTRNFPEYATDVGVQTADGRRYWEPGTGQMDVRFTESRIPVILNQGNTVVPALVKDLCAEIGTAPSDVDVLVTNQPNRMYLRNWQAGLRIDPGRHLDTFDRFGNLYGAGVPVTVDHALREGALHDGELLVMAAFAHAGDFAAAAAVRWGSLTGRGSG